MKHRSKEQIKKNRLAKRAIVLEDFAKNGRKVVVVSEMDALEAKWADIINICQNQIN